MMHLDVLSAEELSAYEERVGNAIADAVTKSYSSKSSMQAKAYLSYAYDNKYFRVVTTVTTLPLFGVGQFEGTTIFLPSIRKEEKEISLDDFLDDVNAK